ncbi:uncharacterized protein F5891DRAFT_1191534 [Suillus fuscotomentosus]|uniref:Homeobox domain-containing protein n=1 Tax=Suillus fuscotomentosus TaxID=1912939 RepID=A0AAD4E424_9AGAM|nr:uncharacterized protein F5891DRAFT_1191534 [Suillus fuscotomentosus]KAG1897903.1 hypothetical protein F5891DRAFT_1191534 [Suillus fuscotomentosus]
MSTPTTANIPSNCHTPSPIPSRRIQHEHRLPHHDTNKRTRRSNSENMTVEQPSSASDSSSQSGMADNETEPEQQSELSSQTAPAPKKKRTRTLTTPHQSAVLHALLAQSRFPTTTMREEVGRQIGLSARKVQIWFQNQRQKARRPQSDSAPLSRPTHFGPFPGAPQSTSSSHTALDVGMAESFPDISGACAPRNPVPRSGPPLDPGLSGPGIPGRCTSPYPTSSEEYPRIAASPDSTSSMQNRSSRGLEDFPSLTLREPVPRILASRSFLMHEGAQSPPSSRVLPPIHFSALESRISTDPYMSPTSSLPPSHLSSTSIMHQHEPTRHTERTSTVTGIPPPFALQPQPQWDPNSFAPFTRPEFASFSSPSRSGRFLSSESRDRFAPHVSPELHNTREYHLSSGERQLTSPSVLRPFNTFRDIIDPRRYPARESSSKDASSKRLDDDEPRRNR